MVFVAIAFCLLRCQSQILRAFGITFESLYLALFILGNFALSVFLYLFETLENLMQRRQESQADIFSCSTAPQGQSHCMNQALLQVFLKNKQEFVRDGWYSMVKDSHPSLIDRINHL